MWRSSLRDCRRFLRARAPTAATCGCPTCQNNLIARVAAVQKNTVVVLHTGAPVECPWAGDVSAVLCMYLAGEGIGEATDALLWGEANPCGRLPETWPLRLEDTPCYLDYPGDGVTADYREGVYVGYRWYDGRRMPVRWPFGHGLSYTGFVYRDAALDADTLTDEGSVTLRVKVRNSGALAGAEVVQLYVSDATGAPVAGGRVVQSLRGFQKVWLEPGQECEVSFAITARDLSHYSAELQDWYAAPGRYELRLGHSSRDIRMTVPLEFSTRRHLPLTVDENTPLGILLADPRTAEPVRRMLESNAQAMANGGGDGLMPPDAMAQMLDAMPLRGTGELRRSRNGRCPARPAGYAAPGGAVLNLSERSRKGRAGKSCDRNSTKIPAADAGKAIRRGIFWVVIG